MDRETEKRKKLLVVDDIGAVRNRYASLLRNEGYEVMTAPDGKEALELAGRHLFDMILLDLNMPGMSGLDVLNELRATYVKMREVFHVENVPVLCVSGYISEEAISTAHLLGAVGILEKPVNLDELLATVNRVLKEGCPVPGRKKTVVILDPSMKVRSLFRYVFEGFGWAVVEGSDPDKLLAVLKGSTPDLILVSLPPIPAEEESVLSKFALVADRMPIIVVAQNESQGKRVTQWLPDDVVVLIRPFGPETLTEAVERARSRSKAAALPTYAKAPGN